MRHLESGVPDSVPPDLLPQVTVPDRGSITTANAETRVVTPAALQPMIDASVAVVPSGVQVLGYIAELFDDVPQRDPNLSCCFETLADRLSQYMYRIRNVL